MSTQGYSLAKSFAGGPVYLGAERLVSNSPVNESPSPLSRNELSRMRSIK